MRPATVAIAAALLLLPTAGALDLLVLDHPDGGEIIVGYRDGALDQTLSLVRSLGATVLGTNEDIRYVVISTTKLTQTLATLALAPAVEYSETNDATRIHGAQWNGAQWNGAQWNGAQWNGAQWNGAQWNGAQWNGAQWNWPFGPNPDPGVIWQWGLVSTRAPAAWNVSSGTRGASLCVLDSGVAWDHRDLANNTDPILRFNAIDPNASAYDDGGHGTHVAGIAAAEIANDHGVAGVGNVKILPVKVLNANGTGKEDDLALGITWCANHGASVALMALGVDEEGPTLRKAIEYARSRDVLLVASAGNSGSCTNCVGFPARHPDVVAVSAYDRDGKLAPFSSRGPQVDLAAPGVEILGPFLNGAFVYGSGTSQAAAFVAGAAALVRDAHPDLTAKQARERLEGNARDLGAAGTDPSFGRGAIDVEAALAEG